MPTRILVVDDEGPMRALIREYLEQESNFQVVAETATGEEAVGLAKQYRPEIVLMDLCLPGMNGLKATQLIKKSCPASKVIMLTNYEFEDLKDRARESSQMVQLSAFLGKREISTRLLSVINSLTKQSPPWTRRP